MAGTATPPPAPPAAPIQSQQPPQPPQPPAPPATPSPPDLGNDPNLAMAKLVSKSAEKNKKGAEKAPETTASAPPEAPAAPPADPPAEPPKLTSLLGKALKFTQKPGPATPPTPPATPPATPAPAAPTPPADPAAPAADPAPPKKPAKTKKAAPQVDVTSVATAAATAATQAAMSAFQPAPAARTDPLADLSDDDRKDYEVAAHLAKMDPRYADAPKIILDHVKRSEDYASRWEAANPGKEFNPADEEHNEFFETLQRPWSANDFQDAKVDMAAEKKFAKFKEEQQGSIQNVQQDQAHIELAPAVDKKFTEVTVDLAKAVGDDVHKVLTTEGWEGLQKSDPVAAQVLATTLQQMHPVVEAAIEIDDSRQRVVLNMNNPAHAKWNQVVTVGEANLVGHEDDKGRKFAKRADFVRMTPAQQSAHWFLTTEMIIQGMLDYASEQVKVVTDAHKTRLKEMGFERKTTTSATPPPHVATTHQPANPPPPNDKPISPTVGSGPKVGDDAGAALSKEANLMKQISGILFRR